MNDTGGDSTTQQLLTVLVQSTAELHQSMAELSQSTAELHQSNKQQNHKIDLLTDQIGYLQRLSHGLATVRASCSRP
ncbi:MAG: hypothetical protein KME27_06820 [Lyngbya sp. HA4199-MV5]|jgi:uncharacterized coiled-coil protein SlyX|nr:hypothetical protein [Lyngbya sp. HA4199-MV5]